MDNKKSYFDVLADLQNAPLFKALSNIQRWQRIFERNPMISMAKQGYVQSLLKITNNMQKLNGVVQSIENDFNTAKNTFYCQLQEEELKAQEAEIKELKAYIVGLELTIKAQAAKIGAKTPQQLKKNKYLTLCPNITPSQVAELWERLRGVFNCNLQQFSRLFDDFIKEDAPPIRARSIADAAALVYFLREYKIIQTPTPFAVLEKVRAFECNGRVITSKQYRHALDNKDLGGYIGKWFNIIETAIMEL